VTDGVDAASGRPKRLWQRLIGEPLFQFLVIGACLFGALSAIRSLQRPVVHIDAREFNQLISYWTTQNQRPPDKAELAAIIDSRINEELLAREAQRLGFDKDDLIIRRRLAQKMTFVGEDAAAIGEPTDAELRAYYARTAGRYASSARVSFRQAYFSGDRPGGHARDVAVAALEAAKRNGTDPAGDPFLLPLSYQNVDVRDLLRDYEAPYVKLLGDAPVGRWAGPVASPFGWHLIRISARQTADSATAFEQARNQVRDAWLADKQRQANAAFRQSLRDRYRVIIDNMPADQALDMHRN
jgi:parvulin-like peptidyl-prolyl isomerase